MSLNFPNFREQEQMQDDEQDYYHKEQNHYEQNEDYGQVEPADLLAQFEEIMTGIQQLRTHVESVQSYANDTFEEYDAAYKLNQSKLEEMQGKMKSQAKLLK